MSWNSRSVSRSVSAAVGSSRIRIDTFERSALAISSICCSARDSRLTRARGRRTNPSRESVSSARRCSAGLCRNGPVVNSAPRNRFSSTVMSGTRLNSWKTALMPCWRASCTDRKSAASPRSSRWPSSGLRAPATMLIKVDLPAPFSPKSTWTSPARRSKSTRSRACTPGNHLLTPRRRSRAGASELSSGALSASASVSAIAGAPQDNRRGPRRPAPRPPPRNRGAGKAGARRSITTHAPFFRHAPSRRGRSA